MIGKIRYFFWSVAFSGCMLIYSVWSGNMKKMIHTVSEVRTNGAAGLPDKYKEAIPKFFHDYLPNVVKRKVPCHVWYNVDHLSETSYYPDPAASACTEKDTVANNVGAPDETGAFKGEATSASKKQPDKSKPALPLVESKQASRDDIVNGNYVQIDGKYYVKREDNLYNVNNKKVFFQNNHRVAMNENEQNKITDVSGRKVNAVDDTPEVPTTTEEVFKVLKKAQMNQKAEQELLNKLDQEN